MRFPRFAFLAFLALLALVTQFASAQQTATTAQSPQRDAQAIAILNQCLAAAGGVQAVSAIQDVTATGTITYGAGDQSQQGPATIKLRGLHRFRLDTALPDGAHSWIVGKTKTFHRNPDGSEWSLPPQNAIKPASATFPLFHALAAVQDTSFDVTYAGIVTHNGQQVHDIVVHQTFPVGKDPSGWLSGITKAHIYIDAASLNIQAIQDKAYRRDGEPGEISHETQFSDYRTSNGILTPFSVVEFFAGQELSTIQINQVNFNTSLTETDFQ